LTVGIANFGSRVEGILEVTSADLYGPSELREWKRRWSESDSWGFSA
jgi:hypothetical protein